MKLAFLGRWSSNLVPGERNVSFVLDERIAFDFGPHSLATLLDRGHDPANIELLLLSHMHLDHFAGVPELLWYRSIYKAKKRLVIVGPQGVRQSTRALLELLNTPKPWYTEQIDTMVDFREDAGTDFVQIFHGNHTVPDNAYRITLGGATIFYSGDTSFSEEIVEGARGVDCLIHEMTYTDADAEMAKYWGHSTFGDAMAVFERSGAERIVPVHLTRSSRDEVLRMIGKRTGLVYPPDVLEL